MLPISATTISRFIDLLIPIAFPKDTYVTPGCLSIIAISVENRSSGDGLSVTPLSKELVEGMIAVKKSKDTKSGDKKNTGEERESKIPELEKVQKSNTGKLDKDDEDEYYYTHSDPNLNLRLTLNALKFLNPAGVTSVVDEPELWIEPNESKPYIAFAMSIGDTEREGDLFVAEAVSSDVFL